MFNKYLLFIAIILLSSCEQTELNTDNSDTITEADLFLESEDFKQYAQIIKDDGRIIRNALKSLTAEEKERYFCLLRSASPEMTDDDYNYIVSEIQQLTGINTDARLRKLHEARVKLLSNVTFSKQDLLKAMQRHCLNRKSIALTRSTEEVSREECLHQCSNIYAQVYNACDPTGGYGSGHSDYELWCQTRYCEMIASDAYDECAMGCE